MARELERRTDGPKLHVCLGNPGYPVWEKAMRKEGRELIVEYYRSDVAVGDYMMVGTNLMTARTYCVRGIRPSPERKQAYWLALEAAEIPVTVAGQTYGPGARSSDPPIGNR